jgi:hypothetical protein
MTTTNDASWEQAIADQAEKEVPLSGLQEGEMLSNSSDEFATRVSSLRYQGYVPYWDSRTGGYNECPQYMRWQITQITHPDGVQKYTFTNPHIKPDYGLDLFCPLNPLAPEYYIVSEMGFLPCRKMHMPHQDAVNAHLQKSHKRAYEALARSREDTERGEDRDLQKQMLQSNQDLIQTLAGQVATQVAPPVAEEKVAVMPNAVCRVCGKDFTKATRNSTLAAIRGHKAHCK